MTNSVLISFIIPVLNDLEQALNTVTIINDLECSENVEVILVDDGSQQPISFTLPETSTLKLSILRLEENSGRSTALNNGVMKSCGKYVSFLDVDCEPDPNYIHQLIARISEGHEALFGHINFINDDEFIEAFENNVQKKRKNCSDNWELELTSACLTLPKDYFNQVGGFSSDFKRYGFEDRDFLIRLKRQYPHLKVKYCTELIVNHNDNTNLDSYLNKFFASGKYSSLVFRKKHPDEYKKMSYSKVDINTSKLISWVPIFLVKFICFTCYGSFKYIFNVLSPLSPLKAKFFKALKGLAYLNGTLSNL
jgi:GT2 family glycosyltransferase